MIGGLTPFTTIDFPGRLAAVLFCQGCPWRCGYCHNPHLQPRNGGTIMAWETVMAFVRKRRGLLDGIVFSGGEPLWQRALGGAMRALKEEGFAVALHTGGGNADRMRAVLPHTDWVGFDFKAPFASYEKIAGVDAGTQARTALLALIESGVEYEIRTTVDAALSLADLYHMADQLAQLGISHWVLQKRRGGATHGVESFMALQRAHGIHIEWRA